MAAEHLPERPPTAPAETHWSAGSPAAATRTGKDTAPSPADTAAPLGTGHRTPTTPSPRCGGNSFCNDQTRGYGAAVEDQTVTPARESEPIYEVKAVPWEHGHVLYIVGEGVTQTHDENGTDAETMVRDWLSLMKDQPPQNFHVRIDYVDEYSEDD